MTGAEAIQTALKGTQHIVGMLLGDLSDADILVRPVPGANHIAFQIGHLIAAERMIAQGNLTGAKYPELPPGFEEVHHLSKASADGPGFLTKGQYLELFNACRNATITAVGQLSQSDLDRPSAGPLAKFAPTVGAIAVLISNHTLMHGGQFSVVRRKLGKPNVM